MARLNIAMLSEQAQVETTDVQQQTELEVVGQQAEDAIAEATQIQTDIESAQQAADDAEEVVQQVEEERQVLEQAQQQGGAEQPAMEALQRAMSRFEKRTGVRSSISGMGMESFGSKSTRAQATAIAMEGAVEYIKKIIKMLVDAMAAVWEKVKAFFEKIWVGADRLAKRAKKVEEAAKAAQGKVAPADAKVKSGSVLAYARQDDKVVEGKAFADQYIKQTTDNYMGSKGVKETLTAFTKGEDVQKVLSAAVVKDNQKAIIEAVIAAQGAVTEGKAEEGLTIGKPKDFQLGEYGTFNTNIDKGTTWEQLSSNYNKIKLSVLRNPDAKDDVVKEVNPMSPEDAKRVAYQVAGHMSSYAKLREEQNAFGNEIKKITEKAKAMEKEKDAPVDQIRVAAGAVRAMANSQMGLLVSLRSYDVNLSKAALDYAAASVNLANGKAATDTGTQVAVV